MMSILVAIVVLLLLIVAGVAFWGAWKVFSWRKLEVPHAPITAPFEERVERQRIEQKKASAWMFAPVLAFFGLIFLLNAIGTVLTYMVGINIFEWLTSL